MALLRGDPSFKKPIHWYGQVDWRLLSNSSNLLLNMSI